MKKTLVLLGVLLLVLSATMAFTPLVSALPPRIPGIGSDCGGGWDVDEGSPPPVTNGAALWCVIRANFYS